MALHDAGLSIMPNDPRSLPACAGTADLKQTLATLPDASPQLCDDIAHVVTMYLGRLRRFLQRYECDPYVLDDLTQETALEAIRSAASFRGDSKPETWLFGIALNVARGHRQRMAIRKLRYVSAEDMDYEPMNEGVTPNLADCMILRENIVRISRAIEAMPKTLQQTFDCLFVRGLQYREAAEELSVPVGTIRSRVSRIRKLLTKEEPALA